MWTNFEVNPSTDYSVLSANYLSLMLYDYADIAMDSRTKYLSDLYGEYPVISAYGVMNSQGNWIEAGTWNAEDNDDALMYNKIQYYYMFE